MSSVVKTVTPFINKELLCEALKAVGCNYTVQENAIVTERQDYYGKQKFELTNGRFAFSHDSSAESMRFGPHYPWGNIDNQQYKTVSNFLKQVEEAYNEAYNNRLEAEKKRLEQERLEYVEKQRQTITANAKAQGYTVREEKMNEKIKLVFVRTTY